MHRTSILTSSAAALATLALLGTSTACSADLSDSVAGKVPTAVASPTAPAPVKDVSDSAPGGSEKTGAKATTKNADKATQVHMLVTNNTAETLQITGWRSSGSHNHWTTLPTSLAPGQSQTVANYSAGNAAIDLQYTAQTSGTVFSLHGETPLVGSNQATASNTSTSYTVTPTAESGYNPTFTYTMQPGHTFNYTGQTDTYTVPTGVTALKVDASGGAGGAQGQTGAGGAEITGLLAVTPGEILTVGVAGYGDCDSHSVSGGWGLTDSANNTYWGGNGYHYVAGLACPGGGATVIYAGTDDSHPLLVAGGGGGKGETNPTTIGLDGGRGGYDGSWTGENGEGWANGKGSPGTGGKAGGQTGTQGQDASDLAPSSGGAGGAGGAGAHGGNAGDIGVGDGGGAGSSAVSSDVSQTTIKTATYSGHATSGGLGSVTFSHV